MVRLSELPRAQAEGLANLEMPAIPPAPFAVGPRPAEARIALISTAGLHRAGDRTFGFGSTDYRILPGDVNFADVQMSHISVNFDRSGFQQDVNVVFPLERLRELAAAGEVGSVAAWHYAFMGATDPLRMEASAVEVARLLREDRVDAALLVPV